MIPAIGFAPDVDPTTPGVFTDCLNIDPTVNGFASSPDMGDSGAPALAAACIGAGLIHTIGGSHRLIAGTPTALMELTGTTWTDQSRVGGYTPGPESRWRFAQMGDAVVAANQQDVLQASTSNAFADIAGAPKARIVTSVAGFIFALATNDAVNGDEADRWWCSALYDYTNWTPSVQTQCATGRLLDTPGPIVAGKALGKSMVLYKERSMFLGTYLGPPVIWDWQQIPGTIGAFSHESVVDVGTAHYFIGVNDFWMFDGSRPVPIGATVREWFFANANPAYLYLIRGYYDAKSAIVYWYFASSASSGTLDSCVTYNIKTNQWGRNARAIECTVDYIAPDVTFDTLGNLYATFSDITGITYDSPRWFSTNQQQAVFDTTHTLKLLAGNALPASITTGDIGDDSRYSTLSEVRCRFQKTPESGVLTHLHKSVEGDVAESGATGILWDGKFDVLASDRWHRAKMDFTGQMVMTGYDFTLSPDGTQ